MGFCSTGKDERSNDLPAFIGVNSVLVLAGLHSARDEVRLVKVVHGMKSKMRFDPRGVDVAASACFFHSPRGQFKGAEAH